MFAVNDKKNKFGLVVGSTMATKVSVLYNVIIIDTKGEEESKTDVIEVEKGAWNRNSIRSILLRVRGDRHDSIVNAIKKHCGV
jgi:hypothetical protein